MKLWPQNTKNGLQLKSRQFSLMVLRFFVRGLLMKNSQSIVDTLKSLKQELAQLREQSLQATRQGDFMKVARLTTQAARLNKSIMDCENEYIAIIQRS